MKRVLYLTMLILMLVMLASCGKNKTPEFNQDKLIELTSRPKGITEKYEVYTLHICIYNNCTVEIYADDFEHWFGEEEVSKTTFLISQAELDSIKKTIVDYDAVNLSDNVGSRDLEEGTIKGFTIYTGEGEKTSKGLSPSNTRFLKVYDFVYEIVREKSFTYCGNINNIQLTGYMRRLNNGPRINDDNDNPVISTDMIQDFVIVPANEAAAASPTDAASDDDLKLYGVAIMLNEEGTTAIYEATNVKSTEPLIFFLYNNDALYDIIAIDKHIEDGTIYLNKIYDETEVNEVIGELEESLQTWRTFKAEEDSRETVD